MKQITKKLQKSRQFCECGKLYFFYKYIYIHIYIYTYIYTYIIIIVGLFAVMVRPATRYFYQVNDIKYFANLF
jgi:hypothetical protein